MLFDPAPFMIFAFYSFLTSRKLLKFTTIQILIQILESKLHITGLEEIKFPNHAPVSRVFHQQVG